jgi:hypothetical protein
MSGIIDTHAHLGFCILGFPHLTAKGLLKYMDRHGIEKSVVLPLVNPEEEDMPYTSEQAAKDCARHPDRLIPFANVDPRRGSNDGNYDFLPLMKYYADMGCRGFGEILASLPTNDPRMKGIYRACDAVNFPVVFDFRLGDVGMYDPVGMPYLEEVLKEFPQTIFIGHGPGWWADISADVTPEQKNLYPSGPIVPHGSIDKLLAVYPNLHADLSANSARNALTRDPSYAREFVLRHYRKLLFGTDRFIHLEEPLMIDIIRNMELPAEVERAIFRGNAMSLLHL